MNSKRNFTFNVLAISVGQFLSLVINFFTVTLTARYLGVEDYGNYNYLLSIVFIASKLTDLGLSNIVFRESSKHPDDYTELNLAITIRLIVFLIIGLLLNIVLLLVLKFDLSKIILTNIFFLATIFSSRFMIFRDILDIPFKVNLQMIYSNIFSNLDNLLFLALIIIMPFIEISLKYVIISFVVSSIPGFVLSLFFLNRKYNFSYRPQIKNLLWVIRESLPLAGFLVFITIFNQIDILLLSLMDSEYSTGIYAVASRLVMPLTILPTAIATTFFPKVVSNFNNKSDNNFLYNLINKILFVFSISFSLVITFNAESIITTLFGLQYVLSAQPMIFLIWSCIFLFFCYVSLDFFTADGKQETNFMFSILIVSVLITILLPVIPRYSYNGAAFAKLLVSVIGTIFIIINLKKLNIRPQFINHNIIGWLIINLFSCYFLSYLPFILYLIIAPFALIISAVLLKCFSESELRTILEKINKEKWAGLLIR